MTLKTTRSIAAAAFRLERRSIEPLFVARCTLGVAIALLAGFLSGHPLDAVAGAIGALSTGFGSLQGVYRTRAATMLGMALAMTFSAVAGSLTARMPVLAVVVLSLWGYLYGITASLGPAAAAVGVNAVIALLLFDNYATPATTIAEVGISMLAGGVIQTLLLVVLWPVQRYPEERNALAQAYRALAGYAEHLGQRDEPFPQTKSLESVRRALADPRPFGRRAALAAFQALLNEAERLRSSLARIAAEDLAAFEPLRESTAAQLNEIAAALEQARAPHGEIGFGAAASTDDPNLQKLMRQLKTAWRYAAAPIKGFALYRPDGRAIRAALPDIDDSVARIRSNLSLKSPFGRHAVRIAVTLAVTGTIAHLLPAQRGYWISLTALLVLRPDFTSTLTRGFARIGGTVVGVLASTALVLLVPDTPHVSLALAIVFAALGYAVFQINYALYTLCITAYVVFILSLTGTPEESAIVNRLFATLGGGTIAMLSYLVWPTWEASHARARLAELLQLDRRYLDALVDGLRFPKRRDPAALASLRYSVWAARAAAEESVERMLAEPESTHELSGELALAIASATRRLARMNIALGSLYLDPATPPRDFSGLRDRLDPVLEALAVQAGERGAAPSGQIRAGLDELDSGLDDLADLLSRDQKP